MKKLFILLMLTAPLFMISCNTDDDGASIVNKTGNTKTYDLSAVSDPSISGSALFEENEDGTTLITLNLNGTSSGMHPAHIHMNTAAESGDIVIDLTAVDGSTGMSSTVVDAFNDGTAITYEELLDYDGYINVHKSADDLGTLLAQGDIGSNELTGNSEEYALGSISDNSISGTATFSERINGSTLIAIALEGTTDGDAFPAHIHEKTAAEGGAIIINLDTIRGPSGVKLKQIDTLNTGEAISYNELLALDGYINAHLSKDNLAVLVAQGDIGQNRLTGNTIEYTLDPVSNPEISGTAIFSERVNGETLVELALVGTVADGLHPAHIHMGSVEEAPGAIVIDLTNVAGTTGISKTNVAAYNDGTPINYTEMENIDGYINVHLSEDNLGVLIAQGNVGENAQ